MTNASETFEEEYEEFDDFDDDEDERGLSGFVVLIMGIVMLGAFFSVVWIAYQQGVKNGAPAEQETPYVAADPDPIKIENAAADTGAENEREVYDVFDGGDTDAVTVLAEGPEEPIDRAVDDPIGSIAAGASASADEMADAIEDGVAALKAEDDALLADPVEDAPAPKPTPAPAPAITVPSPSAGGAVNALSGSYLVQVGAFGSDKEANANWGRMKTKLGAYLDGKAPDVQSAEVNGKTYHRLRIGPFSTADAAKNYCIGLKERGQDCLIKPK